MRKLHLKIDWRSKLIDLFIVIVGITIAFKLNTWNESRKSDQETTAYIASFYDETMINQENLVSALDFTKSTQQDIETLKQLLLSDNYEEERIKLLTTKMMAMADFSPSTTTMENILASGEFDLIKDIDLRKQLISAYNAYKTTAKLENLLSDYVNDYVTPYFMENFRFSNFSPIDQKFTENPRLENIVLGYEALLLQQIGGYERNLEKLNALKQKLSGVN